MPEDRFRVTATGLNLRSEPRVGPTNRIAVLPQGHEVTKLAESSDPSWWRVATVLGDGAVEGFVAHRFLAPSVASTPPPGAPVLPAVHLAENRATVTRALDGGRAFPIGEGDRPGRPAAGSAGEKAAALGEIIAYLAVDDPAHLRYQSKGHTTFCNIYGHDYCYLAGVYLPRVWWTSSAIVELAAGGTVAPSYDQTVRELTANQLLDWLLEYGSSFGWARVLDLDELQGAANAGEVCVICGQRVHLEQPGHVVAVVPETPAHSALRVGAQVTTPLQSQAGAVNFQYGGKRWWLDPKFRNFGFWRHA
jgi:Bacterial SH3 domain